ncbi:MAG: response regulator [Candidatus Omnitrophica bacterium]|nr:response regulator [Candidatus Omnitrophota bacterium]
MKHQRILIIDDNPDILDVLDLTLSDIFEVTKANNGAEGLEKARQGNFDLIITDYMMPVMTGPEFCRELRKDILLSHVPIIMLTGKNDIKDQVTGINSGADDYLIKPFEPESLLARINMIVKRTVRNLDANPLTHLPGNASIMEELQNLISADQPFAVGYCDLDKFKIYNDKYGFEKGDEVIKSTARTLIQAGQEIGGTRVFVGHIGGDDFVFACPDEIADRVSQRLIELFNQAAPGFYSAEDREAGFIIGKDRQGNETKAGLMTISIGIVSNVNQKITHVAQVGEIGAELKKFAKAQDCSNYVRDKRKADRLSQ